MAFWIPIIMAAVAAGSTIAGAAAADAGTGNTGRIKELRAAQRAGRLVTAQGRMTAEAGLGQARRAQADIQNQAAKQLATMGATSGADVEALLTAEHKATAAAYEQAGDQLREAAAGEESELEARKQLRRQRRVSAALSGVKAGVGAGAAAAEREAYKEGKDKPQDAPNFAELRKTMDPAVVGQMETLWGQASAKNPTAPYQEYNKLLEGLMVDETYTDTAATK